jgi:hypothetical protein
MKSNILLLIAVVTNFNCCAQEFENLTFNNPDLTGSLRPVDATNPRTPFIGQTAQLLPGWTVTGNGIGMSEMLFLPGDGDFDRPILLQGVGHLGRQGYQLFLSTGLPILTEISLKQTGRVPADALGLTFSRTGNLDFYVNNEIVYRADVSGELVSNVDLSRYSGQVVDLEFRFSSFPSASGRMLFDIDGFTRVPEPSTYALCGLGALFLVAVVKCQRIR